MRRSNTWFALILIASALLLSGARNATAQGLGPRQSLPQQRNNAAQQTKTYAEHEASFAQVDQAVDGQSDTNKGRSYSYNNSPYLTQVSERIGAWIAHISSQHFFSFIVALATGLMAWFNYQLVGVTDEMTKATAEAAKAAIESAKAAELALYAERPYLFVENQKIGIYLRLTPSLAAPPRIAPTPEISANPLRYKGQDKSDASDIRLEFNLRNRGKGVAEIRAVYVRMLLGRGLIINQDRKLTTIGRTDADIKLGLSIIGPNEIAECSASGLSFSLPLDTVSQLAHWELSLRFVILVGYLDVYGRRFSRAFPFEYRAPQTLNIGGIGLKLGPILLPAYKASRRRYG
jgi:hypothetical protein